MLDWIKQMMGEKPKEKQKSNTNRATSHVRYENGNLSIDGMSISGDFSGRNIQVRNGKIIVDGQDITPDAKTITIEIHGNVAHLESGACQNTIIHGDAGDIDGGSGSIQCGNISGSLSVGSGRVNCGDVKGNVTAGSGNVTAKTIFGQVKTGSGNIKHG
jgi:hypothetical protein